MSKRTADDSDDEVQALKAGQRPIEGNNGEDVPEFEDEYEDEFESEDEIFEAGVDGRPDAEREAEEQEGQYEACARQHTRGLTMTSYGSGPSDLYPRTDGLECWRIVST